jgi:hypothetical protein
MQHVIPNQQSQFPQPNYVHGPQQQGTVYTRTTPQQNPTVQPLCTELPRLKSTEPDTFDGDELQFRNWNQGWQALVGNNPSIYNAEKLIRLKNAIKTGTTAHDLIKTIPLAEDGYASAMDLLLHRYGDTSKLKLSLFNKLCTLPQASNNSKSLRQTYDKINQLVAQMEGVGEKMLDASALHIVTVISSKYPRQFFDDVDSYLPLENNWNVRFLLQSIDIEISRKERSDFTMSLTQHHSAPQQRAQPAYAPDHHITSTTNLYHSAQSPDQPIRRRQITESDRAPNKYKNGPNNRNPQHERHSSNNQRQSQDHHQQERRSTNDQGQYNSQPRRPSNTEQRQWPNSQQNAYSSSHQHNNNSANSNNYSTPSRNALNGNSNREYKRPRPCLYCDGDHWDADCTKYPDSLSRRRQLINKQMCVICTNTDHIQAHCNNKHRRCRFCQECGKHPSSARPGQFPHQPTQDRSAHPSTALDYQRQPPPSNTIVGMWSAKTIFTPIAAPKTPIQKTEIPYWINRSDYINAALEDYMPAITVLARIMGQPGSLDTRYCQAIFDSGSQRSYVTNSLAQQMKLPIMSHQQLKVNKLNNDHSTLDSDRVQISLATNEPQQCQNINCQPCKCH